MITTKTSSDDGGSVATAEKVVEVRNLKKSFGEVKVLRNLNLDLYDRENLVIGAD
jgi:ABC-type sugar transport system ATPase subunit